MTFQHYPKCKYHASFPEKPLVVVYSAEEEKDLGVDWYDAPGKKNIIDSSGIPYTTEEAEALREQANYPKCKYHLTFPEKEVVTVSSKAEEEALGEDWFDTPSLALKATAVKIKEVQKKIVELEVEKKKKGSANEGA